MGDIREQKPDRLTVDEMAARIEEDLASLYSTFIDKLLKAESGKASTVIEEYIGDRFDVRARWYLSAIHKESHVEPYLATLGWVREKDVEALIEHFASSLPHRELVDARIVGRISYWKSEAMRCVREKALQRGVRIVASPDATSGISNLASSKPALSEAAPMTVEHDPNAEATSVGLREAHAPVSGSPGTADQDSGPVGSAKSSVPDPVQRDGSAPPQDATTADLTERTRTAIQRLEAQQVEKAPVEVPASGGGEGVLAHSEFWGKRQSEFERYGVQFDQVSAHRRAEFGKWILTSQGSTWEEVGVPRGCMDIFNAIAIRATSRLPRAYVAGDAEPCQVWLDFMRAKSSSCGPWGSPIAVSKREWERMAGSGKSLSEVRTEFSAREYEELEKAKESGKTPVDDREQPEPDPEGEQAFRWLQDERIERVFKASADFCFILGSGPDVSGEPGPAVLRQPMAQAARSGNETPDHGNASTQKSGAARRRGRRSNPERRDAIRDAIIKHGAEWREHLGEIFKELDSKPVPLGDFQGMEIDLGDGERARPSSWDDLDLAQGEQRKQIVDALRKYVE